MCFKLKDSVPPVGMALAPGPGGRQGWDVVELRDGGHAFGAEPAAALQLPVLARLEQHCPHQARHVIAASLGKMTTTRVRPLMGSFAERPSPCDVEPLQQVGAPELAQCSLKEGPERQHIISDLGQ